MLVVLGYDFAIPPFAERGDFALDVAVELASDAAVEVAAAVGGIELVGHAVVEQFLSLAGKVPAQELQQLDSVPKL